MEIKKKCSFDLPEKEDNFFLSVAVIAKYVVWKSNRKERGWGATSSQWKLRLARSCFSLDTYEKIWKEVTYILQVNSPPEDKIKMIMENIIMDCSVWGHTHL